MMHNPIHISQRVVIDRMHWLRPMAQGFVVEFNGKRGENCWLIAFDDIVEGGGFMEGDTQCLWLDSSVLHPIENEGWYPGKEMGSL